MPNYCRIVSKEEADRIVSIRSILPSVLGNDPYGPNEVVHIFDRDSTSLEYVLSAGTQHFTNSGEAVLFTFRYLGPVEVDESGWPNTFVHRGPILLKDVMLLQIFDITLRPPTIPD